jgi:hypothetical protein
MVVSMNNISIVVITDSLMKTILIKSEMNFLPYEVALGLFC